ncbi:hypothetical protein QJS10_CPA01g00117 [Acorus calamus]|uniref:Uncharacterized protein n=1 Tax=Acorus calamus TaxID=4465 RepID=A0AAV9FLS1_ACOCL|nr:hypothetical protein QJS10_CPA01g00117 [Acorus calamus]
MALLKCSAGVIAAATNNNLPPPPAASERVEIRICVNRTCRRQGSMDALETLSGIVPAGVSVTSCGCLGRCGSGPNLVVLPGGVTVSHCGTAARAAQVVEALFGRGSDPGVNLEALALRRKAEAEVESGRVSEAEALLSQAIELKPSGGLHFIYKCRSVARLKMGDAFGALEDATEASRIAPDYPQAYLCQGDAYLAMEEWGAAEEAYSRALLVDPSIRRSKSFKSRVAKLEEKLATVNMSS